VVVVEKSLALEGSLGVRIRFWYLLVVRWGIIIDEKLIDHRIVRVANRHARTMSIVLVCGEELRSRLFGSVYDPVLSSEFCITYANLHSTPVPR